MTPRVNHETTSRRRNGTRPDEVLGFLSNFNRGHHRIPHAIVPSLSCVVVLILNSDLLDTPRVAR